MAVPAFMTGISISLFSVFNALLIGAGCFALGFLLAQRETKGFFPFLYIWTKDLTNRKRAVDEAPNDPRNLNRVTVKKPTLEIENLAEIIEDFKMVLVVRNDLKMGKGKIAAQCRQSLTYLLSSHATLGLYKKLLARAPKALSRWENCGQVKVVLKIESESDLLVLQMYDSMTVMAILGPSDLVDDVTGSLKLL
ncbi:hypothetical protein ZIOFF_046687 [Zingiber officinale]|uniref:peptidyl-tRNA hydrolase n=1 Tax=Zingiber officinale TaxID=94328 RepID=A0A8J5KW20_ZINOF|nr:hypothetical protein ZIOFF_046687 [Zingiber officinale]